MGVEMVVKAGAKGPVVKAVVRTSPAEGGGLRVGDAIVRVADRAVATPADVTSEVRNHRPGESIEIVLDRGGAEVKTHVTLAVFPGVDQLLRLQHVGTFARPLTGLTAVQGVVPGGWGEVAGKVVVLDFWASWCVACRLTTPILNDWYARMGALGVAVIGVSNDISAVATKAIEEFGIKYPVGVDKEEKIFPAYGVSVLPTMFIIDKRGVVREVEVGFEQAGMKRIEGLLATLAAEKV
jgi:peroxiredoxin